MTTQEETRTEQADLPAEVDRAQIANVERQRYHADWWNPRNFDEARAMANMLSRAPQMLPPQFVGKPDAILAAWSLGAPLGLSVLASLQNIAVINGRPSVWGQAALAVVLGATDSAGRPVCESFREWEEGEGDDLVAICEVRRRGWGEPVRRVFSVEDAKQARLWLGMGISDRSKREQSVWFKYPRRMLQMRARSWAMRDAFPDALSGLPIAEEIRDVDPSEYTIRSVEAGDVPESETGKLKKKLGVGQAEQTAGQDEKPAKTTRKTEPKKAPQKGTQEAQEDARPRLEKCVESEHPPGDTSVVWVNPKTKTRYVYRGGTWGPE